MTGEDIAPSAPLNLQLNAHVVSAQTASWWSMERVLYGVAVMVGGWLRLWTLGAQPLSLWEASNSWPAWLVANGMRVHDAPTPISALYYGLQWLLFWTGVNNDGGARFISAVAGVVLIVLPWWWRNLLGRRAALILAFLIAIDAWLWSFSRLADGAGLAVTLGILSLVSMSQVARQPGATAWKKLAAIAGGLLLVAGPMGWNFIPVVAWWGWLLYADLVEAQMFRRRWLPWLAGAVVLGATFGLARMDGLAWLASGMSMWIAQFDGQSAGPLLPTLAGSYDLWWPWLRLWTDAVLLALLGIGGVVALTLRVRTVDGRAGVRRTAQAKLLGLCGGWLVWGTILCLVPGRSPFALPMLGLPLLLLSAYFLDGLLWHIPRNLDWREASAVVLTLLILLVSGFFWLTALLASRNFDPVLAQAALIIFGLAVVILVAFGAWANRRDAAWIAASLCTALLLVVYVRSSWKLNFGSVEVEPAGWQATMAHPEMRLLVNDMETLSSHRVGDPYQLPVQVQMTAYETRDGQSVPARPDPVLGWELRNMRNLTWVTGPQVAEDADPLPLVLTPAMDGDEMAQLDLPSTYAGSRYHVDAWWLPSTLAEDDVAPQDGGDEDVIREWSRAMQPWWRWFVYREATIAPQTRDVILWAPLDITVK